MKAAVPAESLFASYAQLTKVLLPEAKGIALLDGALGAFGHTGGADPKALASWLRQLGWTERAARVPTCSAPRKGCCATAIPLERSDGTLLGVLCIVEPAGSAAGAAHKNARSLAQKLKPVLDSLHRELAAVTPERTRKQVLTERTAELEWLFKVTSKLHGTTDDRHVLEELLSAATERLKSSFGVIVVPDRRLTLEQVRDPEHAALLRASWQQAHKHLLTWVERRRRPLLANGAGRGGQRIARCKLLAVPIMRDSGRVMGLMAFFNAPDGADFERRHAFLARHLGKQTAGLVEAQFDLMTGLYTREGLTQMYRRLADPADGAERSVLYVDIDHMHVVNELHGFELGNELIVRIADLLAPPLLPEGALAARISADRFAVVFPEIDTRGAVEVGTQLQEAAGRLVLGPAGNPVDVSLSCGVAALVAMPQGLARALAAAEIACKSAKNRGRRRVELYACDDQSMMRRHDDVVAVGQLRSAFKSDRLLLYAQRIVPLQDASLPGGYEILMRLRTADGGVVAPGALINAANRYQLLPSVDRWISQRALQTLAPYRRMLRSRGISVSINISGQSLGDETFIHQLREHLRAASLPPGALTIEITEQAALRSLARASELIQMLKPLGCQFALDDFGTGANSLTYLKTLAVQRVKIDGSFVRDIVTNPRSQAVVAGIVELARGFEVNTVAEFVENEAIADAVRKLGVDYAQGYAFGKPEPLPALLEGLAHEESQRLHRLFLEM